MTKRAYYELARQMPVKWLLAAASDPSTAMTPMHCRILRLAARECTR